MSCRGTCLPARNGGRQIQSFLLNPGYGQPSLLSWCQAGTTPHTLLPTGHLEIYPLYQPPKLGVCPPPQISQAGPGLSQLRTGLCFLPQTLKSGPVSPLRPSRLSEDPSPSPLVPLCLGSPGGVNSLTNHRQTGLAPAITSPNSFGHLTRLLPALGQGPVPRTHKPGSCRDFRLRGPPGLTPLNHFLVWTLLAKSVLFWGRCLDPGASIMGREGTQHGAGGLG